MQATQYTTGETAGFTAFRVERHQTLNIDEVLRERFRASSPVTAFRGMPVPLHGAEDQQREVDRHQTLTLDEFLAGELSDPEVRAEYEKGKRQIDLSVQALELRLARGMTQQQLAEAMGTKQSVISRFERGEAKPTTRFLEKLARALGTELIQVFRQPRPGTSQASDDIIEATCGMLAHLGPMTPALLEERRKDLEREERKAGCPPRKT